MSETTTAGVAQETSTVAGETMTETAAAETTTETTAEATETTAETTETTAEATETTAEATTTTTEAPGETTTTEVPAEATTTETPAEATASCSVEATRTLTDAAEVTGLSACTTFTGSLAVATDYVGAFTLGEVEAITGSLNASSVDGLTHISAPALKSINNTLYLNVLPGLIVINFPALTTLNTLDFYQVGTAAEGTGSNGTAMTVDLNALETVTNFYVTDSALTSLEGISLGTVNGDVQILNNTELTSISLPVKTVAHNLLVEKNSAAGAAVAFPDLTAVNNELVVQGASSLSVPVLVAGGLALTYNTFSTLDLPKLESTVLMVQSNPNLTVIDAPVLTTIGGAGFNIKNNTRLTGALDFPVLHTLTGGVVDGNYSSISVPDLPTLDGSLSLTSSEDLLETCAHLASLLTDTPYTVNCTYGGITTIHSSSGKSTSHSDKGEVIGGSVGGVVAFFVIVGIAAVGGYFWWMRRRNGGGKRRAGRTFGGDGFEMTNQGRSRY